MTTPNPTHPTPSDMPGANPQLAQAVSTAPPAPITPPAQPPAQPQETPAPPAPPPATGDTPPEGTDWKEHARLWESRAKGKGYDDLAEKARKYDEEQAAKRTKEENDAIAIAAKDLEIQVLRESALRERVARETGVLPTMLGGTTEEAMRQAAQDALAWKGNGTPQTPPPPQTAAVPASTVTSADTLGSSPNRVPQLTKEQFVALPPAERMTAVRAGQCLDIGIGVPNAKRRMGNQLEVGAAMGQQPSPPGPGQPVMTQR